VHALVAGQRHVDVVGAALLRRGGVPEPEVGVCQDFEVVLLEDGCTVAGAERLRRLAGFQDDPG